MYKLHKYTQHNLNQLTSNRGRTTNNLPRIERTNESVRLGPGETAI